ncbi:MAG: hypothetical protein K6L75_09340 [Cellvibrionaceae bacterium]
MQIRIVGASFALGIPKTGFGVNASTFAYIQLRNGPNSDIQTLAVDDHFSVGGKSGTFIWSNISTSWVNIDSTKYPWVYHALNFTGKTVDLSVKGTLLGSGKVDIQITFIDKDGETQSLVSKMDIQSSGFQLTGLTVRGKLKYIPGVELKACSA